MLKYVPVPMGTSDICIVAVEKYESLMIYVPKGLKNEVKNFISVAKDGDRQQIFQPKNQMGPFLLLTMAAGYLSIDELFSLMIS